MEKLHSLAPQTLGAARASSPVTATFDAAQNRWRVSWLNATNQPVQAECSVGQATWSKPAAAAKPVTPSAPPASTPNAPVVLAAQAEGSGRIALRSGKRVVGRPPRFPSASLIFSQETAGTWRDLGFADEPLEVTIETAALAVAPDFMLAAYLIATDSGPVCRVVQLPRQPRTGAAEVWRKMPSYPQAPGMAGLMVGMDNGVLIAAGGANFPDGPPWEGGKKSYYDSIYVLKPGDAAWSASGKLAAPRGYGATVTIPGGVLVVGGEYGDHVYDDSLIFRWDGKQVRIDAGPKLPEPVTSAVAVVLDNHVYVAGGYGAGQPRLSRNFFWKLNLAEASPKWQVLPSWPGPTRALAVAAAVDGAVYVMSGIEISAVPGKTPPEAAAGVYHRDAYRYRPGGAWEKLPDLPWSAIAAPSPAPVTSSPSRVFVLGGVDGRQVGNLPRATVLPDDILCFDVQQNTWRLWPEAWPIPVVCIHTIETKTGWIMPSGETMAGKRTTDVGVWRAGG